MGKYRHKSQDSEICWKVQRALNIQTSLLNHQVKHTENIMIYQGWVELIFKSVFFFLFCSDWNQDNEGGKLVRFCTCILNFCSSCISWPMDQMNTLVCGRRHLGIGIGRRPSHTPYDKCAQCLKTAGVQPNQSINWARKAKTYRRNYWVISNAKTFIPAELSFSNDCQSWLAMDLTCNKNYRKFPNKGAVRPDTAWVRPYLKSRGRELSNGIWQPIFSSI